jgi:hypothetical protein
MTMPAMTIHINGDGCWPDLQSRSDQPTADLGVACLPHGMLSGAPSVMIRINEADGRVALGETSLALFLQAADAFRARYGDPRASRP